MEIWAWVLAVTVVIALIAVVVDRRRGRSDTTAPPLDFNTTNRTGTGYDGSLNGPTSSGGGGGG